MASETVWRKQINEQLNNNTNHSRNMPEICILAKLCWHSEDNKWFWFDTEAKDSSSDTKLKWSKDDTMFKSRKKVRLISYRKDEQTSEFMLNTRLNCWGTNKRSHVIKPKESFLFTGKKLTHIHSDCIFFDDLVTELPRQLQTRNENKMWKIVKTEQNLCKITN